MFWESEVHHGFNLVRVYLDTFMRYNMTQILYLLHPKEEFGRFGI
jgi:hypothetical protein